MEVHRWPAVPTAPKTIPGIARFKSADSSRMIALFPPSSRIVFPKRVATLAATCLPTAVEPVKELTVSVYH